MMRSACFDRVERTKQEKENASNGDGHDNRETPHGALLILKLSAPRDEITRRQFNAAVDLLFRFRDESAEIASRDIALNDDTTLRHLPADLGRAFAHFNFCDLAERN